MQAWIRDSQTGRALLALALFCGLALRMLVPAGYMPTATPNGVTIILCSSMGQKQVVIDLGQKAPVKPHAAESPCLFAAGLGGALIGVHALIIAVPFAFALPLSFGAAIADLTIHRLAAPPPPAQGPPAAR